MAGYWAHGVGFFLFAILPVWIIKIMPMGFVTKLLLTLVMATISYFSVEYGGTSRGFIAKR